MHEQEERLLERVVDRGGLCDQDPELFLNAVLVVERLIARRADAGWEPAQPRSLGTIANLDCNG